MQAHAAAVKDERADCVLRVSSLAAKLGLSRISMISGASVCEANSWFPMTRAKAQAEAALKA